MFRRASTVSTSGTFRIRKTRRSQIRQAAPVLIMLGTAAALRLKSEVSLSPPSWSAKADHPRVCRLRARSLFSCRTSHMHCDCKAGRWITEDAEGIRRSRRSRAVEPAFHTSPCISPVTCALRVKSASSRTDPLHLNQFRRWWLTNSWMVGLRRPKSPGTAGYLQFLPASSPRAITWAWISAAPSKMLRMRASQRTRLMAYSSA